MEKNLSKTFQVVLDLAALSHVMRGVLRGVLRFSRDARDWVVVATQPGLLETLPPGTVFDGAIVQGHDALRRYVVVLVRNIQAGEIAQVIHGCL